MKFKSPAALCLSELWEKPALPQSKTSAALFSSSSLLQKSVLKLTNSLRRLLISVISSVPKGTLFRTQKGELSVRVKVLRLLTKNIRPLPDKFHGLSDQEIRYRQRYVDLIMNEDTRKTFRIRSKAIAATRQFMMEHRFMEVETPMLHPIPGGASAKPFITHHNALDMDMYLRIAPELYLKRLVVGGFERVFELNRSFRNEGVDVRHNPEFTMMEFYAAYKEYHWLMDYTEKTSPALLPTRLSAQKLFSIRATPSTFPSRLIA